MDGTGKKATPLPALMFSCAPLTLSLDLRACTSDFAELPTRHGVVVLEDAGGRTVQVVATGDIRGFARRRLREPAPGKADLRSVSARLLATTVGSVLEADLVYLSESRRRLPGTYRAALDRWRAWFVHIDPDAETPSWRKSNLSELEGNSRPSGVFLGPMPDKDAAGRYFEILDDLFELCRYPRELARAPRGAPCAYKEMGRCPAACDGSEPMSVYRSRVRQAIEFAQSPITEAMDECEAAMRSAARAQEFAEAERHRRRLEALAKAARPAFAWIGDLMRLRMLIVLPGERRGWARLVVFAAGRTETLADVDASTAGAALDDLGPAIRAIAVRVAGRGLSTEQVETTGLVCTYLFRTPSRGRAGFVRIGPGGELDRKKVLQAMRRAAKLDETREEPDRELGG